MPELLTESFCERCGTRYTFESAAPTKVRRLGRFKTLSKGLKNYVLSDDTSLDEALAAARSDDEREMTAQQLDAFHATFNFCMTCRQYTCANCWNAAEGRCLTCAPHVGHEILPAPFPDVVAQEALHFDATAWPSADLPEGEPEPVAQAAEPLEEIDLAERLARLSGSAPVEAGASPTIPDAPAEAPPAWPAEVAAAAEAAEARPELEPVAAEPAPEPIAATADQPPVEAAPPATVEPAASAAEPVGTPITALPLDDIEGRAAAGARRTSSLLGKFRPGQNIDAELAAYEAALAAQEAAASAAEPVAAEAPQPVAAKGAPSEPAAAEAPQPEPAAVPKPEPAVAEAPELAVVSEPEPVAAPEPEPQPEPVAADAPAEPQPEPVAASAAQAEPLATPADLVEQPTWRIVAPDVAAGAPNGHPADEGLPAAASTTPPTPTQPEWPVAPEWPAAQPSVPFLAQRAGSQSAVTDALWAASARDVVAAQQPGTPAGGVQPCSSCGLSLSATARFCRRCGTRQGT